MSPRPRVRAVLLDVDDTLVDTRGAFRVALGGLLREWLPHLDAESREAATLHWAADPGGHFRAYTRGELDFATQRRRRAVDLHARYGGPSFDDAGYRRWDAAYEAAFRAAWQASADAAPLLDVLAGAGVALGVVTNLDSAYQRAKLAAVGLAGRFDTLVGIDALGVGKPDPRVFRLACTRLGVTPGQAAYVGDELDIDARGARDAGLLGIWLDRHLRPGPDPADVPVVRGLAELPGLLGLAPEEPQRR